MVVWGDEKNISVRFIMGRQVNKTLIGAFVMGAIALVVIGVLLFGSGWFLAERKTYVLFFAGSVKGLNVGAPVSFRGVELGQVTDIKAQFDPRDYSITIAVYIAIDPSRLSPVRGESGLDLITQSFGRGKILQQLIEKQGMRAQLQMQSLVTGLLEVGLDFYPDTPVNVLGIEPGYPEIPTIPSDMEKLQMTVWRAVSKFEKLPIEDFAKRLMEIANGVNHLINSPELTESLRSLDTTLQELRGLVQKINNHVGPLAAGMEESISAAHAALEQTQKTLATVESMTAENSTLRYQLTETLEQVSEAARSLRIMADYFEQHPEAVIRGKGE